MTDGPACFPRAPFEDNCHLTVHTSVPHDLLRPLHLSVLPGHRRTIAEKSHDATINLASMTTVTPVAAQIF